MHRGLSSCRVLVLDSLKFLVWSPAQRFTETASEIELNIPVIENLELSDAKGLEPVTFTMFCHQISATLESLTLKQFYNTSNWSLEDLQDLFQFPIPTLRKLSLTSLSYTSMLGAMCAFIPDENEDGYRDRCLPNLQYLSIGWFGPVYGLYDFRSRVLDLMKGRRTGEVSPFHLDFSFTSMASGARAAT